jgi:hypothetical protein
VALGSLDKEWMGKEGSRHLMKYEYLYKNLDDEPSISRIHLKLDLKIPSALSIKIECQGYDCDQWQAF